MGFLEQAKGISSIPSNNVDIILGFPGSGKTTLAATYPKPMLYIQIGNDGGGIVMRDWDDNDIKYLLLENSSDGTIYTKLIGLLEELRATKGAGYNSVVIDAYSSIEETMIQSATKTKGRALSWDERGSISQAMINLRDTIVALSIDINVTFVEISHLKQTDSTDNISGESTTRYIPKMSQGNGNIMLERANNVMYCARKVVETESGKPEVKFLTYIGAHPNIDTKFRYKSEMLKTNKGIYIEDCTYEKIQNIINNKEIQTVESVKEPVAKQASTDNNPFDTGAKQW